uniref:Uncharacterized protein n=1 Tax=Anopheles coluzzii TaxID=1518534 RepID=A0A8W7PC85_ANOCL
MLDRRRFTTTTLRLTGFGLPAAAFRSALRCASSSSGVRGTGMERKCWNRRSIASSHGGGRSGRSSCFRSSRWASISSAVRGTGMRVNCRSFMLIAPSDGGDPSGLWRCIHQRLAVRPSDVLVILRVEIMG